YPAGQDLTGKEGKIKASDWADTSQCPPSVGGATFLIVAYSAVIAIGLLGNAGLVFIIARQQELRNVTNILIANLSCSDILMCIVCLPVTVIYTLMDRWVLGEALCKVSAPRTLTAAGTTALTSVQSSLFPSKTIKRQHGSYEVHLPLMNLWAVSSLNKCFRFHYPCLSCLRDHLICMELWPSDKHRLAYTTSLLIFQYCLPLLLVLLCYLRIFLRLRRRRDMLERSRRTRGAQRINVMLLAIVIAFALCWLPLNVFNTLFDWHHQALPDCQHDTVFSACHLTAMASTCINPIVYGFLNSNFQRELKLTLQRCQCGNRATESYESFPLSTVGSEGMTKATSLNRMGSMCIPSPRPEIGSAILAKTLPAAT
uniref:Neuropeptide Y receptor Y8a n=1 Tax=Neolamprologus brichardi TaxID=32507 RepID=A0A3Q4GP65_NEOBR